MPPSTPAALPAGPLFGIAVTPNAADHAEIVELVLAAERGGLDLVGVQDHPYQRRFLDTYALIADLLARTSRLSFFPDVTSLPMRPPAMIAKAAASLDVMSGGRFELGLGAGNFWEAVGGMGGSVRRRGERRPALEEAIRIIRSALDVGPERRVVRGEGPFYPIPGYPPGPPPAHRVEIWLGAMAPRSMDLIGRLADGWVPGGGMTRVAEFGPLTARLDEAANAAGRDARSIRRVVNVDGSFGENVAGSFGAGTGDGAGVMRGSVDRWVDTIVGWALEHRIDGFVLWSSEPGTATIERYAAEVVPAVRAALERERGGSSPR